MPGGDEAAAGFLNCVSGFLKFGNMSSPYTLYATKATTSSPGISAGVVETPATS